MLFCTSSFGVSKLHFNQSGTDRFSSDVVMFLSCSCEVPCSSLKSILFCSSVSIEILSISFEISVLSSLFSVLVVKTVFSSTLSSYEKGFFSSILFSTISVQSISFSFFKSVDCS